MMLRKITIDNSVKYIGGSEQAQFFSKERVIEPNTIKKTSPPAKQNKKPS